MIDTSMTGLATPSGGGMLETIKLRGDVHFKLVGPDGRTKLEREDHNLVVTAGLGLITSRLIDASAAVVGWMEVGTSSTAAAASQTALIAAVGSSRTALTGSTQVTTTLTNDTNQYVTTFVAGTGTGALVEAGLFNASSTGTMLARTVFSVINKGALDSLTVTWKVKFA